MKNPIGFFLALIIQYTYMLNVMVTIKCFYVIEFATLSMLFPLTDDIKRDFNAIQQLLKNSKKRSKVVKPLTQFVQFHSNTRQLSILNNLKKFHNKIFYNNTKRSCFSLSRLAWDFSNFWHIILLMLFSRSIVSICSQLLLFEIKIVIFNLTLKEIAFRFLKVLLNTDTHT